MFRFLTFFTLTLWVSIAHSKVIYEPYQNTEEVTIRIKGEITPKDFIEFKNALKQLDESKKILHMKSVVLESNGGSVQTAVMIGKLIRERKLNTYLASGIECASACVHILIGGVQRYAFGDVAVHRATFMYDSDKDDQLSKLISNAKKFNEDYVKSMGISIMLADAMDSTVSWSIRLLTELEKKQWQVFGFDRLAEELYFNQTARERHISRNEFIHIFKSNYEDCVKKARDFEQTVFDCANSKSLKPPSYLMQLMKRLDRKLDAYIGIDIENLSFDEQVEALRKQIRDGKIYKRYTTITEVKDLKPSDQQLKSIDALSVQKMEAANKWWVVGDTLSVLVMNPIDAQLKEIVFELSTTDCNTEGGKKRMLTLPLLANLEAKNSAIYSGQLPFNYNKVIGKGTRCGIVRKAFY
jgi:ATP-dependent protease ClpP protease subunit